MTQTAGSAGPRRLVIPAFAGMTGGTRGWQGSRDDKDEKLKK
ncbi:hypothetical protein CBUD_0596 [Coxiella burnetii Dugway 5J108-111]|uniref:Uncharacterized protein n=1 Tax=Coxiella burnetii (strain Dugway 5J108-111) TaxID=434922 RepID=A9KBQ3_COXBN|nr:hypothetical protein CBUD_0596 [Coxiella burnetii Dugway 5J108-111]